MYKAYIKRWLDLVISLCGPVCLAPLFAVKIIAIKLDSTGSVFFRQKSVGIGRINLDILKFCTMKTDTPKDVQTHLLSNANSYITSVGAFLRKTLLDELPQIINIIKGDMAIIYE